MTVSLGGITLSDDLVLDIGAAGVAYSQRRLIGGASVVQADGNSGGRTLILQGERPRFTLAQVEEIRSAQALGIPVELVHHRGTFTVLITDTSNLQAAEAYADAAADDWYSGTITLIEV